MISPKRISGQKTESDKAAMEKFPKNLLFGDDVKL